LQPDVLGFTLDALRFQGVDPSVMLARLLLPGSAIIFADQGAKLVFRPRVPFCRELGRKNSYSLLERRDFGAHPIGLHLQTCDDLVEALLIVRPHALDDMGRHG
jgi:hypothetical protein